MGAIVSIQTMMIAWRNQKKSFVCLEAEEVVNLEGKPPGSFVDCPVAIGVPVESSYKNELPKTKNITDAKKSKTNIQKTLRQRYRKRKKKENKIIDV